MRDKLFSDKIFIKRLLQLALPIAFQNLMLASVAAAGTFFLHWPVWIVYSCTCLDEVGKIPWVMIHYKKYKWVKDLTREQNTQ